MRCFVSQPNTSKVLKVEVDAKATGRECFLKACEQLGIHIEADYFGLQYDGSKGEKLWLNLRNQIAGQIRGRAPYHFVIRVKFPVEPHWLALPATRHQFYLHVKDDIQKGNLNTETVDQAVKIAALIAQADIDNYATKSRSQSNFYRSALPPELGNRSDLVTLVATEHARLAGMQSDTAKYQMLQYASALKNFGVEYHRATDSLDVPVCLGVGPEGIIVYSVDDVEIQRIEYSMIKLLKTTKLSRKCLLLTVYSFTDPGGSTDVCFNLRSLTAVNALYRSIIEMRSFYGCDTITSSVSGQFCLDLKGILFSFFNENTTLGKQYNFDIRRTCREVHDHARRVLYLQELAAVSQESRAVEEMDIECDSYIDESKVEDEGGSMNLNAKNGNEGFCTNLEKCCVCMDQDTNTVLCPCDHLVCCQSCAECLDSCPICRESIQRRLHVYVPTAVDTTN